MTDSKPDLDSNTESADPKTTDSPQRRSGCCMRGCFGECLKYGGVGLLLFAVLFWWTMLRSVKPVISTETTYITEPLTEDGQQVDYFRAIELELYPPEMKTDDNGFRLLARELGSGVSKYYLLSDMMLDIPGELDYMLPIYEKLGLPADLKPTMTYADPYKFLDDYIISELITHEQRNEVFRLCSRRWTLDEFPMMADWLEENSLALDLVAQAVRKPVFCIPLVRPGEGEFLLEINLHCRQRLRDFAKGLRCRAEYRVATGDLDGAIDDIVACMRLSRVGGDSSFTVSYLLGVAIQGVAYSIDLNGSPDHRPTEAQLQRLADELRNLPPRPRVEDAIARERYVALDIVQIIARNYENVLYLDSDADFVISRVGFDWNVVMKRVNQQFNAPSMPDERFRWTPGKVASIPLRGSRSRLLADVMGSILQPAAVHATTEASRRAQCTDRLHEITLAMLIHERQTGTLPPAWSVDANGRPLHSWRVLLLPYLGQQELYEKIRLDEPWDSQHNRQFHDETLACYQCPSAKLQPGQTGYTVVVGENTAFPGSEGKRLDGFGPQQSKLLLVAERCQPICWMDPTSEITESEACEGLNQRAMVDYRRQGEKKGLGSNHPGGMDVGRAGGGTRFISQTIDPEVLGQMLDGTEASVSD